jgi:hypothetical protein
MQVVVRAVLCQMAALEASPPLLPAHHLAHPDWSSQHLQVNRMCKKLFRNCKSLRVRRV